jgi:hypothetical protein
MDSGFWSRVRKIGSHLFISKHSSGRSSRRRLPVRLGLEALEDRNLLSGGPGGSPGGPAGSALVTQALVGNQGPSQPSGPAIIDTSANSGGSNSGTSGGSTSGSSGLGGPDYPVPPPTGPTLSGSQQAPVATLIPINTSTLAMVPTMLMVTTSGNGPSGVVVPVATIVVAALAPTP